MGLRLMGNYGLLNVKVEEIDSNENVIQVLVPSTIMYVPIKKTNSANPSTGRIDTQSINYYLQFFSDITFLGCGVVPWTSTSAQYWTDIDVTFSNMRKFMPNNQRIADITTNIIKVTDIGSGYYFITHSALQYFYTSNGQLLGTYHIEGCCPFAPGSTNIYSGNFCITEFERDGSIAIVNSLAFVGVRGVSSISDAVYGLYTTIPDFVCTWLNNVAEFIPPDPYAEGGNTGSSIMTGDFDDTSDPIEFPSLPSISATDTGLITLYNPSLTQIRELASYMWTNPAFDISVWKKIFADPIDAILGLSIVPVAVPDGGVRPIAVGNLLTDVNMNVAAQQYVEVQCGTLNVNEFWSSYLDYDPYTKAEIYLPYCGVHQLSVDDIMNKAIEVRYHIDILSGACCAYVKCGESVLYQFIGQCSSSIPVASGDFSEIVASVLNASLAVGSIIGTGGASAPFALPAYTANAVNVLKEKIQKSGSLSGTGGMLAIQKPYLILTRPRQAHPENQSHYTGYPSFITELLSTLSGYTEIESIHLENVPATDAELTEIETLLKGGVIL